MFTFLFLLCLGLLVAFIVGLVEPIPYSMKSNAKIPRKRWGLTVGGLLLACLVLLVLSAQSWGKTVPTSSKATAIVPSTNPTNTPTPSPKPPQTLEEKIKALLSDGETVEITNANDIDTNASLPGQKEIDITLNLGDAFWDINAAKSGVWYTTTKLTKAIFPLDNSIYDLQITANMPTTDAYGKKQMSELELILITKATYNKIDWNNFDYHNIPIIADSYFENHIIK